MKSLVGVVLALAVYSSSLQLPPNVRKCSQKDANFEQCLIQSAHQVLKLLKNDIDTLGLTKLEPFEAGTQTLPKGTRHISFSEKFTNLKFFGFTNAKISKFNVNLAQKAINLVFTVPELKWDFSAEFTGQLLSKPVQVKSPGIGIMKNVKYVVEMTLADYDDSVDGTHLRVVGTFLTMEPESTYVKIDKAYQGTKDISDEFNKQINDNIDVLWRDVKPNYEEFFGDLVAENFNRVFERIPLADLF